MSKMFELKNNFYTSIDPLRQNDMPPTLYSIMNSIVNYGAEVQTKITDLPKQARTQIFNFDYPISNDIRAEFEEVFLTHYMMRRIGFETVTAFQINLKSKLYEVMPKYNKMLEGFKKLDFDGEVELHERVETSDSESETQSIGEVSTTNDNRYSDTPENRLADVRSGDYISDYTYNTGTNDSNNKTTGNNKFNTEENIKITKSDSIDEYQKFLKAANNIYSMIFQELDVLFFGVI